MIPIPTFISFATNKYVLGSILVISAAGYIWRLHTENDTLQEQKQKLIMAVEQQGKAIERMKKDVIKVVKARDDIAKEVERVSKEKKELQDTLNRDSKKKKSLEELAIKKTGLIQLKVNKATQEVFDCFELITQGGDC